MFIFEKKIAEKLHKPRRKETITELLKSSVKTLERFRHPRVSVSFGDPQSIITFPLRHPPHHQPISTFCSLAPQILQIYHTVEESADTLAFASEPIFASLSNVLAFHVSFGHSFSCPCPAVRCPLSVASWQFELLTATWTCNLCCRLVAFQSSIGYGLFFCPLTLFTGRTEMNRTSN